MKTLNRWLNNVLGYFGRHYEYDAGNDEHENTDRSGEV